jgi:hypothetical protein
MAESLSTSASLAATISLPHRRCHLAIARADPGPDAILAFDDDDLASRARKTSGGRETDKSGPDNEAIDRFH